MKTLEQRLKRSERRIIGLAVMVLITVIVLAMAVTHFNNETDILANLFTK